MPEVPSEEDEVVQAFFRWVKSPETRRPGIGGSSHANPRDFIPPSAVHEHLGTEGRVEALLASIFRDDANTVMVIDAEVIRRHYLRSLAILLLIGNARMIKHFVQYTSLQDQHLPYRSRIEDFPFSSDSTFFDRFSEKQWQFCAMDLEYNMSLHLHEEEILPITYKEEIGHGGNAFIYKIEVHEEYNKLVPQYWRTPARPPHLRHTFVLKTYRGGDAKEQYTAERDAFMRLKYESKPVPFIIAYYGSFIDKETYNIVLEYADKGSLEDYMKSNRQPSTHEETIEHWERFCSITHGLAHIHGIPVSANGSKTILMGWHQDVKPANILVFSGAGPSESDVYFKIADLSLSHFKQSKSSQHDDSDLDAFGTRAYGAPETFRPDDDTPYFPVQVRPDVDIWSLGCVLSEVAVWSLFGWDRVKEYRRDRRAEVKQTMYLDGEYLFHDGHDVLQSVHDMHELVCDRAGSSDHVIVEILRLVNEEMLLSEEEPRYSAKQVFHKSKRIIKAIRTKAKGPHSNPLPNMDNDSEPMTDPEGEPQTPPNVPRGYVRGSSPSAWSLASSRVGTLSSARPNSINSVGSLAPGLRSAAASCKYHSAAWNLDTQNQRNDNSLGSPNSQLIHDLPDPPSPASSYQSSINRFNALSIRTQDLDAPQGHHRTHRETVGEITNGRAKRATRERSLRRAQTEKKPSAKIRRDSASTLGSNSEPTSPIENHNCQLPTPPSSSRRHHRSKSTPGAGNQISSEIIIQEHQEEPRRPHLSLQEGLLWKERKKQGYSTLLSGHENLTYLNERDHIFVIDNTESMRSHRTEVFKVVSLLAYLLKDSDPNGLDVCFTQSTEKKNSGSATKISQVVKKASFNGVSDMRTCLSRILHDHKSKFGSTSSSSWYRRSGQRETQKPLSFYVLTDGKWQPNEVGPIITTLVDSMKEFKLHKDHVGIQFIRFGEDPRGIARLNHLDVGLGLKQIDMDIVDTTPWNGNVWKQLLGAINSWYDDDPD